MNASTNDPTNNPNNPADNPANDLSDHEITLISSEVCLEPGIEMGLLNFHAPGLSAKAQPGQFVMLQLEGHTLRRPFAIAGTSGETIELIVYGIGKGTHSLLGARVGQTFAALGPLGQPLAIEADTLLIAALGRGVGTSALLFLVQCLVQCAPSDTHILMLEPASDDDPLGIIRERLTRSKVSFISWEAGLIELARSKGSVIIAAPRETMQQLCQDTKQHNLHTLVYLREHMACGIGACLACAVPLTDRLAHICVDGPAFEAKTVIW